MKTKKCCVFGCKKRARHLSQSIIGSISFPVCAEHYTQTSSIVGWDKKNGKDVLRMGLMDSKTLEWIDIELEKEAEE